MPIAGTWRSGVALPSLAYGGSLTLERSLLRFDNTNFAMTVANDLVITGRNDIAAVHGLELVGGQLHVCGNAKLQCCGGIRLWGGRLLVDGNLTQRSDRPDSETSTGRYAAEVRLTAAPTNAPNAYGVEAYIGGTWTLGCHAYCFLGSDPTNAAIPFVSAKSMVVAAGARMTAEGLGWEHGRGPGYMKTSANIYGAAYGGRAGGQDAGVELFGTTYGSEEFPVDPGSGGKIDPGSGVIRLDISKRLVVDGIITAGSVNYALTSTYCTGGSAGSVCITARKIAGSGTISADGMKGSRNGYSSGIGGGGRVAIYYGSSGSDTTALTVTADRGEVTKGTGGYSEAGTVYWGVLPPLGMLFLVK